MNKGMRRAKRPMSHIIQLENETKEQTGNIWLRDDDSQIRILNFHMFLFNIKKSNNIRITQESLYRFNKRTWQKMF